MSMNLGMLKGKKIIIAGAAGLLGRALVTEVLNLDAEVIAVDLNSKLINKLIDELDLNEDRKKLTVCELDLTDDVAVSIFFQEQYGITGAVNCCYPRNRAYGNHFFDVTISDFNENVSLHLGSAFLFMQECARYFYKHNQSFSLVNIASIYGVVAPKFDVYENTKMTMPVEYAAIKSAIIQLNKYVSSYVKDSKFRVNSVSPGGIYDSQPLRFVDTYKKYTNGKGMLDVEDILGSIIFLLSDSSNYINGQNILVDDGFSNH